MSRRQKSSQRGRVEIGVVLVEGETRSGESVAERTKPVVAADDYGGRRFRFSCRSLRLCRLHEHRRRPNHRMCGRCRDAYGSNVLRGVRFPIWNHLAPLGLHPIPYISKAFPMP